MRPALSLSRFPAAPNLSATMDIQIPALAWQPAGDGGWQRVYHLHGTAVDVHLSGEDDALNFYFQAHPKTANELRARLTGMFTARDMIDVLALDKHPTLEALQQHYAGVIIMNTTPFEALVLTVLSQNRSGETVRQVFPRLEAACQGITPQKLADLPVDRLAELIRPAGPYKAARLSQTAKIITEIGEPAFDRVVRGPTQQALDWLEALPGVAHKTAACVLVYAGESGETLPVDTHLFRVVERLGLADHDGRLTTTVRDHIITTLLGYGGDVAPAHLLFLLLGRSTCTAAAPRCGQCVMAPHCRYAAQHPEALQ